MFAYFLQRRALAKAWNIGIVVGLIIPAPSVVGAGDTGDVLGGQVAAGAVQHVPQLPGIDEQGLALPVPALAVAAFLGQEPEAGRYTGWTGTTGPAAR